MSRKMNKLAFALAGAMTFALAVPVTPASASFEGPEAQMTAMSAAEQARDDMLQTFGDKELKPGQYVWRDDAGNGDPRVVISLGDQLAYLYEGTDLVAVAAISTGREGKPTPTGIFPIREKRTMYHSKKYDNAAMPFMQRIDKYGIAMHAGHNPGHAASHGCIRLPSKFAAKLYQTTEVGTPVLIGS
jgi:lipoprotein-anchoring transpeptidase ErfK/SrfK